MNQTTKTKNRLRLLTAVVMLSVLFIGQSVLADQTPVDKANYKLAGRYSPKNLEKMVFSTVVDAHWLKHSERFWYV
ncbi:MAG: hypothetical protein ABIK95_11590, partial [Acidobacteriota bacterium]